MRLAILSDRNKLHKELQQVEGIIRAVVFYTVENY